MRKQHFIPLVVLLAAAFGCSRFTDTATNSGTPATNSTTATPAESADASTSSSAPFTPSGDPKADIEKMAERFLALDSFKARMEGTGTIPVKTDLEFLAPDRFRLTHYREKGERGEMIVIGKTTYMNIGGSWQRMEMGMSVPSMRETFSRDGMKWFKEIRYVGEETVDGKTAHHYRYTGEMPGTKKEYDSDIWINAADGRPLKIEVKYHSGDLKTMDIAYDYDSPISIEPPIK